MAPVSFEKIGEPLQLPKREVIRRYRLLMELVIVIGYSRSF
jgi:DNA-binding Lrp family transcriptional regulator